MKGRGRAASGHPPTVANNTGAALSRHPNNREAQYNHTLDINDRDNPAYRRPPFSPWRLEVQPPDGQLRDYFLHVLFLTDEAATAAPPAERIEEKGRLGVRMKLGDRTVTALFDTFGPLSGRLTVRRGKKALHDAAFPITLSSE